MATFLAIGAGLEQRPYIRKARALGHRVIALDGSSNAAGLPDASVAIVTDIRAAAEVADLAAQHRCDAMLPLPVGAVIETVGFVNDTLGLRGPSREATSHCADKAAFFKAARQAGVNVCETIAVATAEDAQTAARSLGFPLVIKPRRGSGSKGVYLISDATQMHSALLSSGTVAGSPVDGLLAQKAAIGREVGVDGWVIEGQPHVVLVRDKALTTPPARFATAYYAPALLSTAAHSAVVSTVTTAARALGFTDCLFHADVIVDESGTPWLLEMAPRPAGFNLFSSMLPLVTGRDAAAEMIEYLAGGAHPRPIMGEERHAVLWMLDQQTASGLSDCMPADSPMVAEIVLCPSKGSVAGGWSYAGHVLAAGSTRQVAIEQTTAILDQCALPNFASEPARVP